MTTSQSVVTEKRYAKGFTWPEYLAYIGSDKNLSRPMPNGKPRPNGSERFGRNMDEFRLTDDETAQLRALPKLKVLVLGEDWCPDVFRGAPVVAAMAEAAGWSFRMFQRDDNKDIMAEFMNKQGDQEFESIPVAVLYTEDHAYVGHWIERPQVANDYMAEMQKRFTKGPGETDADMRKRINDEYRQLQTSDEWDRWRHETVREIITLVKQSLDG